MDLGSKHGKRNNGCASCGGKLQSASLLTSMTPCLSWISRMGLPCNVMSYMRWGAQYIGQREAASPAMRSSTAGSMQIFLQMYLCLILHTAHKSKLLCDCFALRTAAGVQRLCLQRHVILLPLIPQSLPPSAGAGGSKASCKASHEFRSLYAVLAWLEAWMVEVGGLCKNCGTWPVVPRRRST